MECYGFISYCIVTLVKLFSGKLLVALKNNRHEIDKNSYWSVTLR